MLSNLCIAFLLYNSMLQLQKDLILASASPRRSKLLKQIGLPFKTKSAFISENYNGKQPADYAVDMAMEKARTVGVTLNDALILAADTIVLLEGIILGKPSDADDAKKMLSQLSERMHEVITGYAILDRPSNKVFTNYELTRVWFRSLDPDEIDSYVNSGSPLDKAGAYGIQDDYGAVFVRRIDGCYYNVVGLPLGKVFSDLKQFIVRNKIQ